MTNCICGKNHYDGFDFDLEGGSIHEPVPRDKRRTVVSVSFNADEMDRLMELRPDGERLTTWIKDRIFGNQPPIISLASSTSSGTRFKVTDGAGKLLFEVK